MHSLEVENPTQVYGWQLKWKGKSFMCCRGLLMMGPIKFAAVYLHFILIIYIFYQMNEHMRDQLEKSYHLFTYYIFQLLLTLICISYLWTAFTDPGVLMRNQNYDHIVLNKELQPINSAKKELKKQQKRRGGASHSHSHKDPNHSHSHHHQEDEEDEDEEITTNPQVVHAVDMIDEESKEEDDVNLPHIYKRRYCSTCNITRPPLASHCSHCDQCVNQFDHHCFVTNSCIGVRNKQPFVFLQVLTGMMCALASYNYFIYAWQMTYDQNMDEDDSEIYLIQVGLMNIFTFVSLKQNHNLLALIFLGGYLFHIYYVYGLFGYKDSSLYMWPPSVVFACYFYLNWAAFFFFKYYYLIQFNQTTKERRYLYNPKENQLVPKVLGAAKKQQNLIEFFTKFNYPQSEFRRKMNVAGVRKSGGFIQGYYNVNDNSTVAE